MSTPPEVTDVTNEAGQPIVVVDVADRVMTIRLNRPERLNSIGNDIRSALVRSLAYAEENDGVRCVVLTGTGRAFSSGGDLGDGGMALSDVYGWYEFHEQVSVPQVRTLKKPVIAAINGICYGAGLNLAATCDIIVATESARFSMIEARMGNGGGHNLPFLIGPQWAKFLMFTGEIISARRAKEISLILEVIPDEDFSDRVTRLAGRIAAMPRHAIMLAKRQMNGTVDIMGWAVNQVFSQSHGAIVETMAERAESADGRLLREVFAKEGFHAFKEARDAAHTEPWLID